MILTSPSFQNDGNIPKKFTCDGGGINPELQIQNVPPGAKSLALIVHDPDAPVPGGFTHWVVWNIDPAIPFIKEESVPPGSSEGVNGAGEAGYAGPCPPPGHGAHHYRFRLYALDSPLELPAATRATELEAEIGKHLLESAELVGLYGRP
ncbi:MAG TPA: YbhB/YbcL family Raf kinase inhibitor-like protein [Candidatus Paceibacterota bacterium]|nr:YbhB/YbcL family Raf kinase inhibitor-like protein [Candidatus Paceibacterota bacterium]